MQLGGYLNRSGTTPLRITGCAPPPAAPFSPSAIDASVHPGRIALSWLPPPSGPHVTGYYVYRGVNGDGMGLHAVTNGLTTSYDDFDVVGGASYEYAVAAFNPGGASSAIGMDPITVPAPPPPVEDVLATAGPKAGQISLKWIHAGPDPVTFNVYTWLNGSAQLIANATEGGAYVFEGAPHVTRSFRVTAVNGWGMESAPSPWVWATPWGLPSPPRAFVAEPAPVEGGALLSWDAPAGDGGRPIVGYRVEARTAEGAWSTVADVGLQGAYLTDKLRGKGVYLRVSALNDLGEQGEPSAVEFVEPVYAQNDPGDFGDAGSDASTASPYSPGDANARRSGTLVAGADTVDVFSIDLSAPTTLCKTVAPSADLDVRLVLVSPTNGFASSNSGGIGAMEGACLAGPAGRWLVRVELATTSASVPLAVESPRETTLGAAAASTVLVPASIGSYNLFGNCDESYEPPCPTFDEGGERPICSGCSDPLSAVRQVIRQELFLLPVRSHPSQVYVVHDQVRGVLNALNSRPPEG